MILGNPDKFAIIMEVVSEWNIDQSFNNGTLIFFVNGKLYPGDEIVNVTLNSELPHEVSENKIEDVRKVRDIKIYYNFVGYIED